MCIFSSCEIQWLQKVLRLLHFLHTLQLILNKFEMVDLIFLLLLGVNCGQNGSFIHLHINWWYIKKVEGQKTFWSQCMNSESAGEIELHRCLYWAPYFLIYFGDRNRVYRYVHVFYAHCVTLVVQFQLETTETSFSTTIFYRNESLKNMFFIKIIL